MVHRIDIGKVRDAEEKTGCFLADRLVFLPGSVNVLLCNLCNLLLLFDLVGFGFGSCEDIDSLFIFQNILLTR